MECEEYSRKVALRWIGQSVRLSSALPCKRNWECRPLMTDGLGGGLDDPSAIQDCASLRYLRWEEAGGGGA